MNWGEYSNEPVFLTAFRAGDEKAFRTLFDAYYADLVVYAVRLVRDQAEAEDIVTDVFLKLFRKNNDFEAVANMRAFLYVGVRNNCFNYLKMEAVRNKRKAGFSYLSESSDPGTTALQLEMMNADVLQTILEEIDNLPPQSRRIFLLRIVNQLKAKEVAELLGISDKTVRNQTAIAVEKLRIAVFRHDLELGLLFLLPFYCSS